MLRACSTSPAAPESISSSSGAGIRTSTGIDLDEGLVEVARERLDDVPLSTADMTSFDLGRTFDAVTCLFSSIGYVGTVERLTSAISSMAAHLTPGGVLVVEPWLAPDVWQVGRPHLLTVDEPDLKIARMTVAGREGRLAIMDFAYLVGDIRGARAILGTPRSRALHG